MEKKKEEEERTVEGKYEEEVAKWKERWNTKT